MDFAPELLRALVAVAEAGGFTRAAERLHLTQSAVSHQIRRLEEQIGAPLFIRTTRKLALTEDGEEFLRHARQILQAHAALSQRFQASTLAGAIRFGVPENFLGDELPHLLSRFARAFPAVRLEASVSLCQDFSARIESGELDLAVAMRRAGETGGTVLRRSRYVWAAAEDFTVPPGSSLPLALSNPPCLCRTVAIEALADSGVEWHIGFTSANLHGLRAAMLAGLGASIIAHDELEPGMKVLAPSYGLPPLPDLEFALIWSANGKMPCSRELGRLIADAARRLGGPVLNRPAQRRTLAETQA
ncbi:LysR family transcriptional regulator [Bosea sp. 62]|uniref:LysR family transcriptional regulator n=1 Tax=unclassified Bosea (in: a-proteobacteria) TaxID=2653178 RepID=UPI00125B2554|nr:MULTISPECIES: LysR family transcriptional regulator [unclassified Bosea (in: a-proteobacteria)]CAD5263682.1 LysR family transcriptional regulator [Bosea sp. 46]CAD5265982.1 LysR family transcriptional regulator [Bosea sp. 21B]CAD5273754.1 LysR family transcriptional regulator [Bosea sp. 7B]VVT56645.1 LysR family transcriptional regulator [Bosea sp. EC-HK365B]VXB78139.1 LysR family transcriptional regulator [Bosea sp. 29B]